VLGEMNGLPQWTVIGVAILLLAGALGEAASHGLLAAISTTAVIAAATALVVAVLLTIGRVLAAVGPATLT
jgi:hypothetical protein